VIVPVWLVFQYSSTVSYIFDPTVTDPGCIGSGLLPSYISLKTPILTSMLFNRLPSDGNNVHRFDDCCKQGRYTF